MSYESVKSEDTSDYKLQIYLLIIRLEVFLIFLFFSKNGPFFQHYFFELDFEKCLVFKNGLIFLKTVFGSWLTTNRR